MLLKIIWDLRMNSFAPKNISLHLILSSWGTGIDSPLVAPKSLGFGFKPFNSQKLDPEWNEDNIVLDTWRVKLSIFQVIVQWGFLSGHLIKPGCLHSAQTVNILQHLNEAEILRMALKWLDVVLQLWD